MDSVKTEKGTVLPLVNLKGKSYLMVAHRLQWLSEKYTNYLISTEFLVLTDEQTVCRATVSLLDDKGQVIRQAQATKRETKKDFSDHTEKAETSSCGRALAMLGLGTQHALADLSEDHRIVDSPVDNPRKSSASTASASSVAAPIVASQPLPPGSVQATVTTVPEVAKKASSFRKPSKAKQEVQNEASGWE